ncbi:MAG TPA: zinc-dependent peptidase [Flavobacteriales bacterium]|nr:zinc-dependent peptidase [Flavobacteriales bacterium]
MLLLLLILLVGSLLLVVNLLGRYTGSLQFGEQVRLREADRKLLRGHAYYRDLPAKDRRRFEDLLTEIIYEKDWIGRDLSVTRAMKLRIAAALVQVTFGYPDLLLLHFRKIIVYPDEYDGRGDGRRFIGEADPGQGILAFSWKHFQSGFQDDSDAVNVGLHEVAHALWFENAIPNAEVDFLPSAALARWHGLAKEEMERIHHGHSRLFRNYAGTNEAEFFAVAVEYFFEQPGAYRDRMPELYACMVELLQQDPLGR